MRSLTITALCLTACVSPPPHSDGAAPDMRSVSDAAMDAAVPPTDAAGDAAISDLATPTDLAGTPYDLAVACPGVFPQFSKQCSSDMDCFVALHQINCCGTFIAIGLSLTDQSRFMQSEKSCESMYPGCGCAQQPTKAEDGRTEIQGKIAVRCTAGMCNSYVP